MGDRIAGLLRHQGYVWGGFVSFVGQFWYPLYDVVTMGRVPMLNMSSIIASVRLVDLVTKLERHLASE